jgi:hypothetical protein
VIFRFDCHLLFRALVSSIIDYGTFTSDGGDGAIPNGDDATHRQTNSLNQLRIKALERHISRISLLLSSI